jgi:ubiquitin-like protein Pup
MNIVWVVLLFAAALGGAVTMKLFTDETCGWIGRIPFLILRIAASRIPREFREGLYEEWEAELIYELRNTAERPITRLLAGMRYASSLVRGSKKAADELGATRKYRDSINERIESVMIDLRHQKISDDVDAILDEIDEVLEEDAEEFVRSYVPKGGE